MYIYAKHINLKCQRIKKVKNQKTCTIWLFKEVRPDTI